MTQIISNNNGGGGGGGASYTAGTGIDISAQNEISVDADIISGAEAGATAVQPGDLSGYQTVANMVTSLSGADDDHYPTAKAVADAISGGGNGDVIGPNSSTDGDIALFDGTTGKIIKDSGVGLSSKLDASALSNNNYGGAWQGDSTHTPTKGVLYDKIHTMDVEIGNKAADNTVVKLSGNQTINGTKTFTTSPIVPSKTADATNTGTAIATEAQVYNVQQDVDAIDELIPSAATSSNQLADKDYVNDGINSVTAYYITKDAQGNQFATKAELTAATTFYSGGVQRTPTRNDYTIVLDDETHNDEVTRYIYNNGWEYQYTINESPLTQAQLDALNSGITSGKVSSYDSVVSTIAGYGNIVTHNTSEFATSTQGAKADSALQPNDNITELNNNAGYLTSSTGVTSVNGNNGAVTVNEVPSTGNVGDVLTKTNDGYEFSAPTGSDYSWVTKTIGPVTNVTLMQGPCDSGFHIPTSSEWLSIDTALTGLGISTYSEVVSYLKMPLSGNRQYSSGSTLYQGEVGDYWSTSMNSDYPIYVSSVRINTSGYNFNTISQRANGLCIRPFSNTAVVPDSTWTVLFQGTGDAGIYHNSTLGLISLSSDGTNWITIADKNLGATAVYNSGDTLAESNCGNYFQWGNNYAFPRTGAVTTSSTQVDASSYGPGNYYSSNTFITVSSSPFDWSSVENLNLRGGDTTGVELSLRTIVNIPGSDFTLVAPATLAEGEEYVIRIISEDNYTMTLGTGFTNPRNVDTSLSFYATDQFVFLAVGGVLELQPLVATGE